MNDIRLTIDGQPVSLSPAPRLDDGAPSVPLHALGQRLGLSVEVVDDKVVLCQGDLCIPLPIGEVAVPLNGDYYALPDALAEPLGLQVDWDAGRHELRIATAAAAATTGLTPGQLAPAFTLPELNTGRPVSLAAFRGKKTMFFAWASW